MCRRNRKTAGLRKRYSLSRDA